jgi:hypothetical protein
MKILLTEGYVGKHLEGKILHMRGKAIKTKETVNKS